MKLVSKITQRVNFNKIKNSFWDKYIELHKSGKEPFVMPFWDGVNKKVIQSFRPKPSFGFLSNRALRDTMFVEGSQEWLDKQVRYLTNKLGKEQFIKQTQEDIAGRPKLLSDTHSHTSHNTIHHLYHIYFFLEKSGAKPSDIETIVEWGGGYGNFAKIWKRSINPEATYIIIDTVLFSCIQWLYLSSVFSNSKINLLSKNNLEIKKGKINLVASPLIEKVDFTGDLFVSTWGLSESSNKAQDYVVNKKWFDAKHLLIGYQDSIKELKYASRLGELAQRDGAELIDIDFIPSNHYAIK